MFYQELFEVDIMNVNLKRISINKPEVKVEKKSFIAIESKSDAKATYGNASALGNVLIGVSGSALALPWVYTQETDDNAKISVTLTINPAADCLLVATAMSRSEASISGDGWVTVNSGDMDSSQRITVWYKKVSAGTHTVTVTQTSSVRMSLKLMCIYNAESLTVVDNVVALSVPINPTATTTKRRLYLLSSVYAALDGTPAAVTVSDNSAALEAAEELRFSAFYDDEPESGVTPTFGYYSSNYTANSINMISFDIEEETT